MELKDLIVIDPQILGGQPVFNGTRVPIETPFDHSEVEVPLEKFLEDFPTIQKNKQINF